MSKETTLTSEMLYDGRIMKLYKDSVELENGKTSVREYIRHSGGASIMAVDEEENVYFVTQYRYPYAAEVKKARSLLLAPYASSRKKRGSKRINSNL